jgi:spore photoproduct lyase
MKEVSFKRVLIERGAENGPLGKTILTRLSKIPRAYVEPHDEALRDDSEEMDKESLRIVHFNGQFLKPCPGTREYICCGYQILHIGSNCPMDCSYCFLQSYINQPSVRIFTNLHDELNMIGDVVDGCPGKIFRIGTGEFADSLCLDYLTRWSDLLLPFFSEKKNCILELKTKTASVELLIASRYRNRIVVAWSLNTPRIVAYEERKTANLRERIIAAQRCQEAGFIVAFHFDPLIHYPGWEEEIEKTVQLLETHIDPESVIWISMGSFRYMPELKWAIMRRFPRTSILSGEFVPGLDKKFRYFKPIRVELYSRLSERLKQWHDDLGIYLCMESDDVWLQSMGWSPKNSTGLSRYLDGRVRKLMYG